MYVSILTFVGMRGGWDQGGSWGMFCISSGWFGKKVFSLDK